MSEQLTKDLGVTQSKRSPDTVRTGVGRAGWKYTDEAYNRRFLERVRKCVVIDSNGCWIWQGNIHPQKGYGQISYRNRSSLLHRSVYRAVHGVKLTFEQQVCHTCDVRRCCNPDHLWLGTNSANTHDMRKKGKHYFANRTHCPKGHPYDEQNTSWHFNTNRPGKTDGWSRGCKACARERGRRKGPMSNDPKQSIGLSSNPRDDDPAQEHQCVYCGYAVGHNAVCIAAERDRLRRERDSWQARAMALFYGGDPDKVTCGEIRKAADAYNAWLSSRTADETVVAPCQHDFQEYSIDNARSPADPPELVKWVKCIKCGARP